MFNDANLLAYWFKLIFLIKYQKEYRYTCDCKCNSWQPSNFEKFILPSSIDFIKTYMGYYSEM